MDDSALWTDLTLPLREIAEQIGEQTGIGVSGWGDRSPLAQVVRRRAAEDRQGHERW
ncbi:MAG: hypothetical protein HQ518_06785 [Rhodopirellula sp.]|nr:hypothetical protein [Rhodopirellula sp.]